MNDDYLKLQYKEGLNHIRHYIDNRYKILQFIGYYNAAILTLGFSQHIISTDTPSFGGILVCVLSFLVSIMGLSTEYSIIHYNTEYFVIIREIEAKLNKGDMEEVGLFTHGANSIEKYISQRLFPVNRCHRIFYLVLTVFWVTFFVCQSNLFLAK
jgi:hypothetical protein